MQFVQVNCLRLYCEPGREKDHHKLEGNETVGRLLHARVNKTDPGGGEVRQIFSAEIWPGKEFTGEVISWEYSGKFPLIIFGEFAEKTFRVYLSGDIAWA